MLTPAMIVVALQDCAMATATGQEGSAKGRVKQIMSIAEHTLLSPARNVVEIEVGAMATATGQMGGAK